MTIEKQRVDSWRTLGGRPQVAQSTKRAWKGAARTYHILTTPTRVMCKVHRTLETVTDYENGVFTLKCGCRRRN